VAVERLAYQVAWWAGRARLRFPAGRRPVALPAAGPAAAVHLSAVARLPAPVADAVAAATARLRAHDPGHHYYRPRTMHVTVLNLDGFDLAGRLPELRAAIAACGPVGLTVRGLNLSPATVFAQGFLDDARLPVLRRRLARLHAPAGRWRRPLARRVAVANAVRFAAPPSAAFLAELAGLRRLGFGRATLTEVEVVRTDRLLSPEGTLLVERVRLAGGLPPG
jgi:hypothetical protein